MSIKSHEDLSNFVARWTNLAIRVDCILDHLIMNFDIGLSKQISSHNVS